MWGPGHPIVKFLSYLSVPLGTEIGRTGCLLSIGTGQINSVFHRFQYATDLIQIPDVFHKMAVTCEQVHQKLADDPSVRPFYCRFNPTLEQKIGLEEWKEIDRLKGIAFTYLNGYDVSRMVSWCANALR